MKLYLCSGHKKSRNWSKPIKWCAFLFNVKIVYTARWRLFATPDTPCFTLNFYQDISFLSKKLPRINKVRIILGQNSNFKNSGHSDI